MMENPRESSFLDNNLVVGEKIVYQSPRKWSALLETIGVFIAFLFFLFLFLVFSMYLQNVSNLISYLPAWMINQSTAGTAQVISILRWVTLFLTFYSLAALLGTLFVFISGEITLTDRRILGKTGRYILRKFNIPLEQISWISYPNNIISKGPLVIHTREGKGTILWNLARLDIFLGYLERQYAPEARPMIQRATSCARAILLGLGLVLIVFAIFVLYASKNELPSSLTKLLSTSEPRATRSAPEASGEEATLSPADTPMPSPTRRPTRTPTPQPVVVDFSSIQDYPTGTDVIMEGQLVLPSGMICDTDCGVFLRNPQRYADKITIFLYIPPEGATPSPNMMARLADKYRESDFKVRLDDGTFVGNYTRVRVAGTICETTKGDLAICQITKIELQG